MSDKQEIVEALDLQKRDDETTLEYTQRLRIAIVSKLTSNGISEDPDNLSTLANFLNDMDRQETTILKLDIENKKADSDAKAQEIIAAMLERVGNDNPYALKHNTGRVIEHEGDLTEVTLVPGELDQTQRQLNYEDFMKEYREKHPVESDED